MHEGELGGPLYRRPEAVAVNGGLRRVITAALWMSSGIMGLGIAAVNGIQPRRCRRSEFIAKLGYGLDHSAIPVKFLAHCVHYDSCHD